MEDDLGGFGVVDGEGGAPVVVAGLAYGAGVDKVAGAGRQGEAPGLGFPLLSSLQITYLCVYKGDLRRVVITPNPI